MVVFDIAGEDNGDRRQYQVDLIDVDLVDVKKTEVCQRLCSEAKVYNTSVNTLFCSSRTVLLSQGQKDRGKK